MLKFKKTLTLVFGISLSLTQGSVARATNQCAQIFENSIESTIRDLAAFRVEIDQAKAQGDKSITLTAKVSDYAKKEQELLSHIEANKIMTRPEFIARLKQEMQKIQSEKQTNAKTETEQNERRSREKRQITISGVIDGTRAIMHRIEPGSFKMGETGHQVDVTLTKPFDLMATLTTQIIWKKVADLAAQKLAGKYQIKADPSYYKGDTHPVESISFNEMQTWIQALNELSARGEPALAELIPDHSTGDVYRLPTEAEWEFVARGRGQLNDSYHFGSHESDLGDYAWYKENSRTKTHPVAEKKPLVIGGNKEFYDISGNVWERVQDFYGTEPPTAIDPQGPPTGATRAIRGGSWGNSAKYLQTEYRGSDAINTSNSLGFRLAREARK